MERPHLELMVAEAVEKHRSFTRSAYLNFKAGQSVLLADYMNNPSELARIYSSIDSIRNDEIYRIDEISIVGYSSPEGSYVSNARLSEQRARALERNLKQAYKLDDRTLRCSSVAEIGKGLPPGWKNTVLPICNGCSTLSNKPQSRCPRREDKGYRRR